MLNQSYLRPGFAAATLAVIYPMYWMYAALLGGRDIEHAYYANVMRLDGSDLVYLMLGALEIYVYASLRKILHDHHNFRGLDVVLALLICNAVFFYIAQLGIDAGLHFYGDHLGSATTSSIIGIGSLASLSGIMLFGALGLLMSIVLLRGAIELPPLLRVFAYVTALSSLFQLTVVFWFAAVFLFPLSMLVLAAHFVRKPDMIEVV